MDSSADLVLRLDGVTRRFGGVCAVDNIDLEIARGQRHVVIGPNGAGKTTLFKLISRLDRVTSGRIELFGGDITRAAPHRVARLGLARTYQTAQIFLQLPVIENVMLAVCGLDGSKFQMLRSALRRGARLDRAHAALEQVDLAGYGDVIAAELGHGQQRQLELAIALAAEPQVLLLDEPAAGLAGADRRLIARLVEGLPEGITVLLIEHDMELALGLADRVTCMHNGATIAEGTAEEIKANSAVHEIYLGRKE
jgi:branched-chain amino acid transport system ATP-binding protein